MLKHIKFLSTFMKAPKKWCTVVHQLSVSCPQCSYIFVQPLRARCIILFIMCAMLGYTGQTRLLSDQVFRRDLAAVIFCLCGCFFFRSGRIKLTATHFRGEETPKTLKSFNAHKARLVHLQFFNLAHAFVIWPFAGARVARGILMLIKQPVTIMAPSGSKLARSRAPPKTRLRT